MLQAVEGIIDQEGRLRILGKVDLPKSRRVIITILDEAPSTAAVVADETDNLALLSEDALARDWTRPEEDEAWSHLGQLPSL